MSDDITPAFQHMEKRIRTDERAKTILKIAEGLARAPDILAYMAATRGKEEPKAKEFRVVLKSLLGDS